MPNRFSMSGVDQVMFAELRERLASEVDDTLSMALHRLSFVLGDLDANGPLQQYVTEMRDVAVAAVHELPNLDPTDVGAIIKVQAAVGDYVRVARWIDAHLAAARIEQDDEMDDERPGPRLVIPEDI